MTVVDELGVRWRAARPEMAGVHLDSAACSRQSNAVIDATAAHARYEAEVGGYIAAQAAQPVLDAGRAAIGALTGMSGADVVFTTGSQHALELLLASWSGERSVACLPGEFGPNLAVLAGLGYRVRVLPVDALGRLRVAAAAEELRADRPALVHLTGIGSHRGIAQPVAEFAEVCTRLNLPLVLDAAQALGQIDCAVGAAAVYSSSRKWLAGPRGVGFLAVRPELADRLVRRIPPPDWPLPVTALQSFELDEANVAARVGYSLALGEHLSAGAEVIRARLAEVGRATRSRLDGLAGWRVVEPVDEPTAITTLVPPDGLDPAAARSALIDEHGILTTAAEIARAPFELTAPVLRVAPHVDVADEDLDRLVAGLLSLSRSVRGKR